VRVACGHQLVGFNALNSEEQLRNQAVRRVLIIEMLLNVLVAAAKAVYGAISGSLAIATDAVHSLLDASANIGGIVVLRFADAPPDEDHPYGHRKLEFVAATVIGLIISLAALRFAWGAIEALTQGLEPPTTELAGFIVIGGTFAVNVFVALWEARKAKELNSAFLAADAIHTASDVVVTAAVMASYIASYYGVNWADPVGALLVVAVIGRVAYKLLVGNLSVLMDSAVFPADTVEELAQSVDGVVGCHRVRSRGTEALRATCLFARRTKPRTSSKRSFEASGRESST
jgi:cation diffusion facilitator family transporter